MFERARGAKAGAAVVDPVAVLIPQLQKKSHTDETGGEEKKNVTSRYFLCLIEQIFAI